MPTDPTLILVTTTAALPREGEGASDLKRLRLQAKIAEQGRDLSRMRKRYQRLKEELAAADKIERLLNGKIDDHCQTITGLRAELAKRGETIGDAFGEDASDEEEAFVKALPTVAEVVDAHDKVVNGALGRLVAHADKATITSLCSQLARAGAIEAKAREVVDSHDSTALDGALVDSAKLADLSELLGPATALASSPGPRDTAEGESRESMAKRYQDCLNRQGEQLVETHRKLTRLAKAGAEYLAAESDARAGVDRPNLRRIRDDFRWLLAELDKTEAHS